MPDAEPNAPKAAAENGEGDDERAELALMGTSTQAERLRETVARVTETRASLLIGHEEGLGASAVALHIHRHGPMADGPFVDLDCATMSDRDLGKALFGDADDGQLSLLEQAAEGTLFISELTSLTLAHQARLLHVLERRSDAARSRLRGANLRIIAALHSSAERNCIAKGLLYRLASGAVTMTPLRDRPQDIPLLVSHLLDRLSRRHGRRRPVLRGDAMDVATKQPWTGNIRQLCGFIERLVVLEERETIEAATVEEHLASYVSFVEGGPTPCLDAVDTLARAVEKAERRAITIALRHARGNRSVAARILGISRRGLYNKVRDYGIVVAGD